MHRIRTQTWKILDLERREHLCSPPFELGIQNQQTFEALQVASFDACPPLPVLQLCVHTVNIFRHVSFSERKKKKRQKLLRFLFASRFGVQHTVLQDPLKFQLKMVSDPPKMAHCKSPSCFVRVRFERIGQEWTIRQLFLGHPNYFHVGSNLFQTSITVIQNDFTHSTNIKYACVRTAGNQF